MFCTAHPAIAQKDNGRHGAIERYLSDFCSPDLLRNPKIHAAIEDVLQRIPYEAFLKVTDRQRPVFFTEVHSSGTARFASSSEIIVGDDEPPCCRQGFTMLKLGLALDQAETPSAIEGVVAHELAHRVLDHVKKGHVNCGAEREANALIKKWGFGKEFKEASRAFGHRKGDPASCRE